MMSVFPCYLQLDTIRCVKQTVKMKVCGFNAFISFYGWTETIKQRGFSLHLEDI